jgi:hypothetical protein
MQLAMRSRARAVLVASGMAGLAYALLLISPTATVVLALPVAFLLYSSAALIGLTALRNDVNEALIVLAGAAALVAVGLLIAHGSAVAVVGLVVSAWLPTLAAAWWLGRRSSQGDAFAGIFVMACVLQIGVFMFWGDPAAQMEPWFRAQWDQLQAAMQQSFPQGSPAATKADIPEIARSVAQMMVSSWAIGVALSLLLARWWQSRMDNPGGFGREFRELRLPRWLAIVVLLLTVIASLVDGGLKTFTGALAQVGMLVFLLQGVAVAHGLVALRDAHRGWLIGMYVVMFVLTPMSLLIIALTGFFDTWLDYRRRAQLR